MTQHTCASETYRETKIVGADKRQSVNKKYPLSQLRLLLSAWHTRHAKHTALGIKLGSKHVSNHLLGQNLLWNSTSQLPIPLGFNAFLAAKLGDVESSSSYSLVLPRYFLPELELG